MMLAAHLRPFGTGNRYRAAGALRILKASTIRFSFDPAIGGRRMGVRARKCDPARNPPLWPQACRPKRFELRPRHQLPGARPG